MKKALSVFLCACMLLSVLVLLPVVSSASDAILIDYGSKWHYVVYEEDPGVGLVHEAPDGWLDGTDDAEWETGTAPIGAKQWGNPVTRFPYQYYSAYIRKNFKVKDLSKITSLTMYIKYDENPTVYLNGTEVWSAEGYVDSRYVEVPLNDRIGLLHEGTNTLQVAISNVNGGGVFDAALLCTDAFEALLPTASDWDYLCYERTDAENTADPETPAPDGWLAGVDSEDWDTGMAPFSGTAWTHALTNTVLPYGCFDAYLRTTFTVDSLDGINSLLMRVIYDEDPVIYLNGEQIWSTTGYKDGGYQLIFINEQLSKLKTGENILCVYFRNKIGGGGSVFDMGLYYNAEVEEIEYYDEDGWVIPASASCTNVYSFGDLNKAANILDGSQDTVCGSGYNASALQTFTAHFRRPEMVTEVYLQCKYEGDYNEGHYGTYDVFAVYGGEETLIGENVPAIIAAAGGYTLTVPDGVPAEAITVKIVSWEGPGWACLADIMVKATGEEVEERAYDSQGHILHVTPSAVGFANFGAINDPANILDGDQSTVCGSGWVDGVEQSVTLTFNRAELVKKIFLQCKNEGPVEDENSVLEEQFADGSRGTYALYALYEGEWTLIVSDVPAVTGYRGGYTVTLPEAVKAEAIKVLITEWHGEAWACVADVLVTSEGPVPTVVHNSFDIDEDGEVSIGDVTALLDVLATGDADAKYDLDGDGEVSISDVTALLDELSA